MAPPSPRSAAARTSAPTARIEPEQLGPIAAEIHRLDAEDGAELALTRVPAAPADAHATPVVLVHGNYSRRNFWISPKGIGLAPFLAQRGFDVWVLELRGHGLSPKGARFSAITAEDHMRLDLAAAERHVRAHGTRAAFWVAHSAGGIYVLGALAAGWLDPQRVLGVATFGSQIRDGEAFLRIPGVAGLLALALRALGHLPAPRFGLGPEIEPAGEMIEFIRWKGWRGRWRSSEGFDYGRGLAAVTVPLASFAGAADEQDPPSGCRALLDLAGSRDKTFVELGRTNGFVRDYGHVDMIVSKEAATEVWPRLARWLEDRAPR